MYLDYSGIRVTQLAKAVKFYTRALGLVEHSRGRMRHGGVWVLLQHPTSQQRLELNWYPRGSRFFSPFVPGEGLDHLGVRVQDLKAAGRRLEKAGATKVDEITHRGQVQLAYYEGPDGVWIELIRSPSE